MFRFYSDYDDDDDADDGAGDVISIHDDDSEPETAAEPAAKVSRLSDDVATTTGTEAETDKSEELMMEYWQANSYSICLAAEDTDVADVLFAKCPQLKGAACLVIDLKPGEMFYLPASWLYEVFKLGHSVSNQPKFMKLEIRPSQNFPQNYHMYWKMSLASTQNFYYVYLLR